MAPHCTYAALWQADILEGVIVAGVANRLEVQMEQLIERVTAVMTTISELTTVYLGQLEILIQLGIIAVLYVPALLLSWRVEPKLEERARQIKGLPGLLRVIVAFPAPAGVAVLCHAACGRVRDYGRHRLARQQLSDLRSNAVDARLGC